jgi:PIN domain nuclease of toxin-antitoxin system
VTGRPAWVIDASALLAFLNQEPGAEAVEEHLDAAAVSAVNWCETYGKLRQAGVGGDALVDGFAETGIEIWPFDAEDARLAGELAGLAREAGLSLADRACLALAGRLGVPAVTADRAWLSLDIGVEVIGIR